MWETIATFLSGAVLALLARVPALSVDGRMVGRLERDLKLLTQVPHGAAQDAWESMVNDQAVAIVEYRREASNRALGRKRAVSQVVLSVGVAMGIGYWGWSVASISDSTLFSLAVAVMVLSAGYATFQVFSGWRAIRAARKALRRVQDRDVVLTPILDAIAEDVIKMDDELKSLMQVPEDERTAEQVQREHRLRGRMAQAGRVLVAMRDSYPEIQNSVVSGAATD